MNGDFYQWYHWLGFLDDWYLFVYIGHVSIEITKLSMTMIELWNLLQPIYKVLGLTTENTHPKCRNKANVRIPVSVDRKTKMAVLKSGVNLHKHDLPLQAAIWLVVYSIYSIPIWWVWYAYVSDSLTHWPAHNIPQTCWLTGNFLDKTVTQLPIFVQVIEMSAAEVTE